jgi:hypothetical protein
VEAWRQRVADPDPLDQEAPARALRPATIEHRIYSFRLFASALVHTRHLQAEEVTSLSVLFEPECFRAGLRFILDRTGRTQRVHNLARSMHLIAKHYGRMDEAILTILETICKKLDPGNWRQMTERKRKRLGQFDDPRNVARLLRFPEQEARRALAQTNPLRAAKAMERAVPWLCWSAAACALAHCAR